jgi:hypothetical protein
MIEEVGGDSVEGDLWLERHQHATELYVTMTTSAKLFTFVLPFDHTAKFVIIDLSTQKYTQVMDATAREPQKGGLLVTHISY